MAFQKQSSRDSLSLGDSEEESNDHMMMPVAATPTNHIQQVDECEEGEESEACLPSDLISPSYFYSNEPNDNQFNGLLQTSHVRLISKMKSLEEDGLSSTTSRYLNHLSRPMSIMDEITLKRDSENLIIGPDSGNVSSRHHFGTHGLKPNLMMNQDKK